MTPSPHLAYSLAAVSSFVGAALLWHVQPMMARVLLPKFGGSAAVWTCALVFYQSALVVGYGYAHWIVHRGKTGRYVHATLLLASALIFPFSGQVFSDSTLATMPAVGVLWSLLIAIGGPYVLISATAPLVQGLSAEAEGGAPYRLFAWSNLGSILGLLAYPFLVEPLIGLAAQQSLWFQGYAVFSLVLLITLFAHSSDNATLEVEPVTRRQRLEWLGLSGLGVAFLMSVSDAISADLTVTPLLWVLPLFFYLLSFVICFGDPRYATGRFWRPTFWAASVVTVYLLYSGWRVHWSVQLGLWCAVLFAGCMLCHGELVRRRPEKAQLTRFYLDISIGGALIGLICAVVLPLILPMRLEVHLTVIISAFIAWVGWSRDRTESSPFESQDLPRGIFTVGWISLILCCGGDLWKTVKGDTTLYRNFYGTLQVKRYEIPRRKGGLVHLLDGRISHGFQYGQSPFREQPTAYFVPESGIGIALAGVPSPRRVVVLGLGVGTLSAYAQPGDTFDFVEINPDVIDAATTQFTYLSEARESSRVHLGDGRMILEDWSEPLADLIAVDAFTGDAIPAHLLTREAVAMYWSRLKRDGVLAINVSNRHAHLWKVVQAHAGFMGAQVARVRHRASSALGSYMSDWMLMVRRPEKLRDLGLKPWTGSPKDAVIWSDDYSPLYPVLKSL